MFHCTHNFTASQIVLSGILTSTSHRPRPSMAGRTEPAGVHYIAMVVWSIVIVMIIYNENCFSQKYLSDGLEIATHCTERIVSPVKIYLCTFTLVTASLFYFYSLFYVDIQRLTGNLQ